MERVRNGKDLQLLIVLDGVVYLYVCLECNEMMIPLSSVVAVDEMSNDQCILTAIYVVYVPSSECSLRWVHFRFSMSSESLSVN